VIYVNININSLVIA